jgi:hypothetical protein
VKVFKVVDVLHVVVVANEDPFFEAFYLLLSLELQFFVELFFFFRVFLLDQSEEWYAKKWEEYLRFGL